MMKGCECYGLGRGDPDAVSFFVSEGDPSDVFFVTCFLRANVWYKLVGNGTLVLANGGARFSVGIIFVGAATIPCEVFELFGEMEEDSDFGEGG